MFISNSLSVYVTLNLFLDYIISSADLVIRRLNLSDFVVLIFLFLSGMLILAGNSKTEHFAILIGSRIAAVTIIFSLIKANTIFNSSIVKFLRQFYPLIFTSYFYGETGYYNNIFFADLDEIFIQLEQSLLGFQPSLWFSAKFSSLWFNELMFVSYFSYYLIVFVFPLVIYLKKRVEFDRIFFLIIFSFYAYYLIFAVFPVVGPQFYFSAEQAEVFHPGIFGKLVKFIQDVGETPTGAFPSSHVGLSWIILIASFKSHKKLFWAILPFAILICFSTVYIKAHYVVDIFAGVISAPVLYFLADWIFGKYNFRRQKI